MKIRLLCPSMTDNPYAPTRSSLSTDTFENVRPLHLGGGQIMSRSFKLLGENFWHFMGASLLGQFVSLSALSTCFGLIVLPHLQAGSTLAGYRYYKSQGRIENLFDGFHKFGPVLAFGLLMIIATVILYYLLIVVTIGALGVTMFGDWVDDPFSAALSPLITAGFLLVLLSFVYSLHYIQARLLLVVPLLTYFQHDLKSAMSTSWKATSISAHTLAILYLLAHSIIPTIGLLAFCVGLIPATAFIIAFRGTVVGLLLDHLYPEEGEESSHTEPPTTSGNPPENPLQNPPQNEDPALDRFKPPAFPAGGDPYT